MRPKIEEHTDKSRSATTRIVMKGVPIVFVHDDNYMPRTPPHTTHDYVTVQVTKEYVGPSQ